ncbi:MAG: DUF4861 family protein [Saprospiraceae bacterium]|nr:DUF4861 family protein [Saprospiraceae bacterium]
MKNSIMAQLKLICILSIMVAGVACNQSDQQSKVVVQNTLDIERSFETVVLTREALKVEDLSMIGLRNTQSNEVLITQLIDIDGDEIYDELLFQPRVGPNSKETYEVVKNNEVNKSDVVDYCYSRFVPERTDDYAWENDKVAFRMFGPTAQKMVEDKVRGGTLTSGVDLWLKRVDYPIINKWYKKTTEGKGSYHEDTGEGLDNFHVGVSRGVGGVAVKKDDGYYFSKNFTDWKTITTGPIRTSFQLDYEAWDAGGNLIKESKTISLDYGNNMSKFETSIEGSDQISAGLTLHEKDGIVTANSENGWVSYWEPHGDSELGTAILTSPDSFVGFEEYNVDAKDLSNAYAHLKVQNNKVIYYAGFGWKKSGQFNNNEEWEAYLDEFADKIGSPLKVSVQ